jgi:hypothetical protein
MRISAMVLGLVLLLAACIHPAASVGTAGMGVQLADDPNKIPAAGPVNPDPRVGPLFLGGLNLHTCTGSVVHSSSGDLILTAAHCLAKQFTATFVPGFANAAASNVWTVDAVYLDPLWVAFKDPRVDYAFARASSAMRPASGARRSAAKAARESPCVVTPRFCARAWSTAPAARRGSAGRRSPG